MQEYTKIDKARLDNLFVDILNHKTLEASIIGSGGIFEIRANVPIKNLIGLGKIPIGSIMYSTDGLVGIISLCPNNYESPEDADAAKIVSDQLYVFFMKYKKAEQR